MARSARVQSTDAIKAFRVSLIRFAESAKAALGDTDAEILRTGTWLRQDRQPYWKRELNKRNEEFQRAKSALAQKRLYKSASGDRQSSVEEEKAFAIAKQRLEEAQQKTEAVRSWLRKIEDERFIYRGQSQRLARTVDLDVPRAIATLDRLLDSLDAYFHEAPPNQSATPGAMSESAAYSADAAARRAAEERAARQRAECAELRKQSLRPGERDAVPPRDEAPSWPVSPRISPAQINAIAALNLEMSPIDESDIVILAKGASSAPRVYLERIRTSSPGDSGWIAAPANAAFEIDDCIAVTVRAVLTARPDWAALFTMPAGSLIVENASGIEYLCDATDTPTQLVIADEPGSGKEASV